MSPARDSAAFPAFERLHVVTDPRSRATAVIAIDSTRRGPAFGGIRRWSYPDLGGAIEDALALARAMTLKCAIAGVPGGGGKTVLVDHAQLDRDGAYRLIGREVARLAGSYYTGPDVGTTDRDLLAVAAGTEFVTLPGEGGPGDLAEATALGVFAGIEAVVARLGKGALDGARVAVQGAGAVGGALIRRLCAAGARVWVADRDPSRAAALAAAGAVAVSVDEITRTECDVFAPCALGGVLTEALARTLPARAIAGSANNVLAGADIAQRLHERGVLLAPDFVINAGALVQGAWFHLHGAAPDEARVRALGDTVGAILDAAAAEDVSPLVVAERWAAERAAGAGAGHD